MIDNRGRGTPDEQAMAVMQAMRDVTRQLESRRDRLEAAPRHRKEDLSHRVLEDVDRLANLVSLVDSVENMTLSPEVRDVLRRQLDGVRRRVTRIGLDVAVDRIRELRQAAESAEAGEAHPLGRSLMLREAFMRYVSYLRMLAAGLTEEHLEDVRASAARINQLAARDRSSPWLQAFSGDDAELVADIDLLALELETLSGDKGDAA